MELNQNLQKIKEIYSKGSNMIKFMRNMQKNEKNSSESIMISYDFQAGNYIKKSQLLSDYEIEYAKKVVELFNECSDVRSMLEVGVGEATTLYRILSEWNKKINVYGFDISWSRIKYAQKYLKDNKFDMVKLFIADLFNIPLQDNSIDLVYTWHTIESNGGREIDALKELFRITRKYLFIFEPSYEFGNKETRKHIKKHGYVKNLSHEAKNLGYNIVKNKIFIEKNPLSANNTGLLLIKKDEKSDFQSNNPYACALTKTPLQMVRNNYFSKDSMMLYPVVDGIPCLLPNNAIIATHYLDKF